MKKFLTLLLTMILLLSITGIAYARNDSKDQRDMQRVIVLFQKDAGRPDVKQLASKIHRNYDNIPAMAITLPSSAMNSLKNIPGIVIEPDVIVTIDSQTEDWGIDTTNAQSAWASGYTGRGVKVAVIDTGIASHQDLNIAGGVSMVDYTTSYSDDQGHGTHVAGIIGARNNDMGTVGIAPEADLYAIKVLDYDGSGYLSDIISGIDWAISNDMDIINMSLGTTSYSTSFKSACDRAYNNGILVAAAAGNSGNASGTGDNVNYPAKFSSVIAVAATNSSNARASFSSTGSTVEVAAPGVSVYSTYLDDGYETLSGTSMATPYVSGDLALLKEAYPDLGAAAIRLKLQKNVIDLGSTGKDKLYGYGLIQAPAEGGSTPETPDMATSTTVSLDKSVYFRSSDRSVKITAHVTDGTNNLPGAAVKAVIKSPNNQSTTKSGTTDTNGNTTMTYSLSRFSRTGTYTVTVTTTYSDYTSSSAQTTFTVK